MGRISAWFHIGVVAALTVFGFELYALGVLYRRMRTRTVLFMALAVGVYAVTSIQGILVRLSLIDFVHLGPFGYLILVIVMSVVLSYETQHRLRTSESRFRSLVEQSPFSIQMLSPDGRTLTVNAAWERLWGVKLEALADYNILEDQQLIDKGIMPFLDLSFAGEATETPPVIYNSADNPGRARPLPRPLGTCLYVSNQG